MRKIIDKIVDVMGNLAEIEELVQGVSLDRSDTEAYLDLYRMFSDHLLSYALSIVKNKEAAEDVVAEVFGNLWRRKDDLARVDNVRQYLFTATRNRALNFLASMTRNRTLQYDQVDDGAHAHVGVAFSPEQIFILNETEAVISETIQKLPPQCREIFRLVKINGLHYKEVARELNISRFTVRNQLVIASKRLAVALGLYSSC